METWPSETVALVDALLGEAVSRGASDLHLAPQSQGLSAALRIDGCLHEVACFPDPARQRVPARLKVLARLPTYETELPQEGRAEWGGREFRVAAFPTIHGERVVVRLFDPRHREAQIGSLGLPEDVLEGLRAALAGRGALFLTGPSGSGKTTAIYACLRHLAGAGERRSIVSIEDPVECPVPGVSQSEAAPARGFTFARALRSALRQDPEVLVVGEIRDAETASIAIEAALTGHLVISTVHTGTAAGVYARLLEMGVPGYLLTSSVTGVLALRLARRACAACRASGCPACKGLGYAGRFPLAEWLRPTPALHAAVAWGGDTGALQAEAVAGGLVTLAVRGQRAVAQGWTTPEEIVRVLGGPLEAAGA